MKVVLLAIVGLLLGLTLALPARADSFRMQTCAAACGKVRNVCRAGVQADSKTSCSALPECKDMTDDEWKAVDAWIQSCTSSAVQVTCPSVCVPSKDTSTTAGGTTTPPVRTFKSRCEGADGIYTVERVVKTHPDRVDLHEECYKLLDARDAIAALTLRVDALEKGRVPGQPVTIPPDLTALYDRVRQLIETTNAHTTAIQALQMDMDKAKAAVVAYDGLKQRVDALENDVRGVKHELGVVQTATGNLAGQVTGVQTQLNDLRTRQPSQLPPPNPLATSTANPLSLPCWAEFYARGYLNQIYDYAVGHEGVGLACSLFGNQSGTRSFFVGFRVGYANNFYDHKMYAMSLEPGLKFKLSDSFNFLLPVAIDRINSSRWERGSTTSFGLLPAVNWYPGGKDSPIYLGVHAGPAIVHTAPPLPPDQIQNDEPTVHVSGQAGLVLGWDFSR